MKIFSTAPEGNELAEAVGVDYIKFSISMMDEFIDWMKTTKEPSQPILAIIDMLVILAKKYPIDANLLIKKEKPSGKAVKKMSLEYRNIELMFIEQLKLQFSQGYNPEKAAIFAHEFYLKYANKLSDRLYEVVYSMMMMDAGSEFEMDEMKIKAMIKEKTGIVL